MPEHRRRFAEQAVGNVFRRFYGESDDKVETVVSVVLDAFEKDEYWQVLKGIEESRDRDVQTIADALHEFGLVDMASMVAQATNRLRVLDQLDALVRDPSTLEKTLHSAIEGNLWVLGDEYSMIASNKTLARTIDDYAGNRGGVAA